MVPQIRSLRASQIRFSRRRPEKTQHAAHTALSRYTSAEGHPRPADPERPHLIGPAREGSPWGSHLLLPITIQHASIGSSTCTRRAVRQHSLAVEKWEVRHRYRYRFRYRDRHRQCVGRPHHHVSSADQGLACWLGIFESAAGRTGRLAPARPACTASFRLCSRHGGRATLMSWKI